MFKKIAVAALLVLGAVSAFGSNFRGADQVYIPIAGHAAGASGTFISDVYLANLSSDEVDVSIIFQQIGNAGGTGLEFKNKIQLKGYERKEFNDFIEVLRAFKPEGNNLAASAIGQLIFNACKKGADCGPASQDANGDSPNYRDIVATSRIYSIPPGGNAQSPTTGQLFTGIPWYHFVSSLQSTEGLDKVFITGFRQTGGPGQAGTYRSNLGVVNASQYSTTTIVLRLYQGTMTDADKKAEYQVTLGPLGNAQIPFSTAFPGITGTNYFVTVSQTNNIATGDAPAGCTQGCPAFLAYGSVLDNLSGDATTLEATYNVALSDDALIVIYPGAGKIGVRRSVRH
jgi:hypothetical protein